MKFWRTIIFSVAVMTAFVSSTKAAPGTFPDVNDLPVRKELPDVMTMNDGTKVTTVAQWRARREEMKAILEHYELCHAPPPPGNVWPCKASTGGRPGISGASGRALPRDGLRMPGPWPTRRSGWAAM